jgi:hypothetical protein
MRQKIEKCLQVTSRLLRWWAAELRSCADDLIGVLLPQRRRASTVYWDGARLLFLDEDSPNSQTIVEIPRVGGVGYWPQTIPVPLATLPEQNNRIHLVVSPQRAFVRQIRLPLAVLPHLDAAVALQLPRLLPVDARELLTDFELIASDPAKNVASIDVAAVKKADVNPVLERLRAWGLHIVSTHLGEPLQTRRFRFKDDGLFGHRFQLRRSDRVLVIAAATLGLACASVAATESYRSRVSLEQAKTVTRVPASAALARRQQLLARLEPLVALTQLEAAPSADALLAEMTMLVPTNTWLTKLELKDQHIRIVGVSPNSGNVVKLVSSSRLFSDVQLRSSMSLGIGTGLDRFEIAVELKAGAP